MQTTRGLLCLPLLREERHTVEGARRRQLQEPGRGVSSTRKCFGSAKSGAFICTCGIDSNTWECGSLMHHAVFASLSFLGFGELKMIIL